MSKLLKKININMKKIVFIALTFLSIQAFSQQNDAYKEFIDKAKKEAIVDGQDMEVYDLLNDFYEQVLQSDTGELNPDVPTRIKHLYENKDAKNKHLLIMFLGYQDYISATVGARQKLDEDFQLSLVEDLEHEIEKTYGKVPVLILIYKVEALRSAGKMEEAKKMISNGLKNFPNSVSLKVYSYVDTEDEAIKMYLVKNHSNHWMVREFGIK